MIRYFFLPSALLLALLLPAAGDAQVRIVGNIIEDKTGTPVSGAEVFLKDVDGYTLFRTMADEDGRFQFYVRGSSAVKISARRMGYEPATTPPLFFNSRQYFEVEVRLDPDAILLAPLVIISSSDVIQNALHEGFRNRINTGFGHYITREDVEARNPSLVSDLLKDVPGVTVSGGVAGNRPKVRMVRAANRNCTTQIWVDGLLMNARGLDSRGGLMPMDYRIDDVVSPSSVEAIEVYRGLSTVPPEFLNRDADCGTIAIWTKRGGRR